MPISTKTLQKNAPVIQITVRCNAEEHVRIPVCQMRTIPVTVKSLNIIVKVTHVDLTEIFSVVVQGK